MSILSRNYDRGTSQKVPLFLYPKNNIEYYEGPIPEFNKELLSKDFYEAALINFPLYFNTKLKGRFDLETVEDTIFDNYSHLQISSIEFQDEKISIDIDDDFEFWDVIEISVFIEMKDGYEKGLIANCFNNFPNRNSYHLDYLRTVFEETEYEEEEEIELVQFNLIELFLNYKYKGNDTQIKNKYTLELIQVMNEIKPVLKEVQEFFDSFTSSDFTPFYFTEQLTDIYRYSSEMLFEKEYTRVPISIMKDGSINDFYPGSLSKTGIQLKEKFDNIFIKWQEEQEQII